MLLNIRIKQHIRPIIALTVSVLFALAPMSLAFAAVPIVQLSTDPYTNTTSQHQTEVEPDTLSAGSTIVSAFQVGRFTDGGSSNIGFATSTNNGGTWTNGFLPGITKIVNSANPFDRVSDPVVAFDARHNVWMISSLAITVSGSTVLGAAVIVNRSTDGGLTWSNPVVIHAASGNENLDKDWSVCDNSASSAFFGNCYVEWDDNGSGNLIHMSTSTNGGTTWGAQKNTGNSATGLGGQPLVQANGTVIVPINNANETAVLAFRSTNGGASWSNTVTVATVRHHAVAGNLRSDALPTAEIDGAGKVFVIWSDCRFESGCRANDMVMSTSTNGTSWTAVTRIPVNPVGSGVDHFIPGVAVDRGTSGSTAHLVLAFYYYPVSNCGSSCQLNVGFSSSVNGGSSWTTTTNITGPITLSWLANTTQGVMVGDYISASFAGTTGTAFPVFMNASAPTGGTTCGNAGVTCHEAAFTTTAGLTFVRHSNPVTNDPIDSSVSVTAAPGPLTSR